MKNKYNYLIYKMLNLKYKQKYLKYKQKYIQALTK